METIHPLDIRVGDRVRRVSKFDSGDVQTSEITVTRVDSYSIESADLGFAREAGPSLTWELLERPFPVPEVGSHWRDPETGNEYVYRGNVFEFVDFYAIYRCESGDDTSLARGEDFSDDDIINRLEPIPHVNLEVLGNPSGDLIEGIAKAFYNDDWSLLGQPARGQWLNQVELFLKALYKELSRNA